MHIGIIVPEQPLICISLPDLTQLKAMDLSGSLPASNCHGLVISFNDDALGFVSSRNGFEDLDK